MRERRQLDLHVWMCACAIALVVTVAVSCEDASAPQGATALPENSGLNVEGAAAERALAAGAKEFLSEGMPRVALARVPGDFVARAQLRVALQYIGRGSQAGALPPVTVIATAGLGFDGTTQIVIEGTNTNRETNRVWIVFRTTAEEWLEVVHELHPVQKDCEYVLSCCYETKVVPWEEMKRMATAAPGDGRLRIVTERGTPIPSPAEQSVMACAAIEDRNGLLSNFVVVHRVDVRRPGE